MQIKSKKLLKYLYKLDIIRELIGSLFNLKERKIIMDQLEKYRDQIDKIDKKITELFEERMDLSKKIAEVKSDNDIGILNARREEEVIQKNLSYLKNKEYRFVLEGFFRNLMNLSKLIQNEHNHH